MHVGEQYSGHPDPAATRKTGPLGQLRRRVGRRDPVARLWVLAAWIGGILVLTAVLARISLASPLNSDGANIALQGWDLLHGHLLLHGWIVSDASFYTFEVPLLALGEALFGLTVITAHIVSALTYAIVAAFAVAVARTNSSGAAAAARCGVVIAVLAAPVVTQPGVAILLEAPQHIGTSAYFLGCFLLIDRAPGWRFTAPLVSVILTVGQVGDATVLYVAVPAVVLVCAYRVLASREIRSADTAIGVAAAASVPLAIGCRAAMRHLGGYVLVPPRNAISQPGQWWSNAGLTWHDIRTLFGAAAPGPASAPSVVAVAFAWVCLAAAVIGLARVAWTWRTASRAEQLLGAAIVANLLVYLVSTMASSVSAREISAVLPCGAVLAARAVVPGRITGVNRAAATLFVAAVAALAPLVAAAAQPTVTPAAVPLAAWLKAHKLSYGIAGYWSGSVVTLASGETVQIRAVASQNDDFFPFYWETKPGWYAASQHDANFMIADTARSSISDNFSVADIEGHFGRPAAIYHVAGYDVMVYRKNLLRHLGTPWEPSPAGRAQRPTGVTTTVCHSCSQRPGGIR